MDTKRGGEPNPEHGKPTKEQMWTLLKEYADTIDEGTAQAWSGEQVMGRPQDRVKSNFMDLYSQFSAEEKNTLDKYLAKRLEESGKDVLNLMYIKRGWE